MTKTHTLGIIGAGMYGKVLIRALQQDPRAKITWVCSATEATTTAAAQEFNIPHWTLDYRQLLADPALDAVVIATPPYLHLPHLTDALAAGKHVLLEKPLAESPASTEQITAAVQKAPGLTTLEASCRHTRLQPKFTFIKTFIDEGKLGRIYHIHHQHLQRTTFIEWNPNGAWAMNKALAGGGPFIDWGVYDLSFHLGLLNDLPELQSVRAFTRADLRETSHLVPFSDIEQHGAAWLEFSDGLNYYYERGAGVHAELSNQTTIYGTQGSLRFSYTTWDSPEIEYFYTIEGQPHSETLNFDTPNPIDDTLALTTHFLDCLDGTAQPLMPISLAAKHIHILFRILSSK